MIKHFAAIIGISAGLLAVAAGQTASAAGRPPGVAHGVSNQYEQADSFPSYDTHTIHVGNGTPYYEPAEITVQVGDIVRWINQPLSDTHTVIEANGRFTSRGIPAREDFCYHFTQEGDYNYSCRFHPWMKGVVHVRRRQLSLQPLAELPEGATLVRRAAFLAANREAIEDGQGGFWLPGAQLTTLDHRSFGESGDASLTVSEAGGRLIPLIATGEKLMVAAYGELLVVDASSGKVLDRFTLPQDVNLARAAAFSEGQLWAAGDDGKTLVFADTVNKIIRTRMLPDEARIVALRAGAPGRVWAVDAGRKILLKLGSDWFTEVPLPSTVSALNSVAVDREGHAWFADPGSGVVGTVVSGGLIAEFSVPVGAPAELLQLSGVPELLLSTAPDSGGIAIVREELGHRLSALQGESNCEGPASPEVKERSAVTEPRERRPQ